MGSNLTDADKRGGLMRLSSHSIRAGNPPYSDNESGGGGVELQDSSSRSRDRASEHSPYRDGPETRAIDGNGLNGSSLSAGTYKVYKRRWFGFAQLTLLNIIVSWDWLTFAPVSSAAATYFHTTESIINWLSTAFQFSFVFGAPFAIYAIHLGPKPSMMSAAALLLLGNWIRYAGVRANTSDPSFGAVMLGQILTGFAQPFLLSCPTRYSDLWFTNRGRVAATALMSLANPFGAALGQLIIPFWVSGPGDVPSAVLYVAIISSLACIPSFFIPAAPPTPAAPSGDTPKTGIRESLRVLSGSLEAWLVFLPFAVYVGFFNSISTILNQVLEPYGLSDTDAGIAGALLIVVGLVTAAITSPIVDRTKAFVLVIKIAVPILALSLLTLIWMPMTISKAGVAGPYVVLSLFGASAFSLVPVAVEYLVELTHPVSPEVTSAVAWAAGQLLGGIFVVISNELRNGADADPPYNMHRALVFTAVIAMAVMPLPLSLGLFGRGEQVRLRRVQSDQRPALEAEEDR